MKKIRGLIERYYDVLAYLFFGGLTTVVNYLVYLPCRNWWGIPASISNIIAWIFAVAFAFLTNKPFVFKSHDWSAKTLWPELTKFVGCRVGSGVLETAIIWLTVDMLHWNDLLMKLFTSVLVIVVNYIGSKFLIFTKEK
ncbi:MAG: GtrA family protein [Oscillospiraceae bacterium]|nr:GtrA family protein [Oscillospiraceae bacterium]